MELHAVYIVLSTSHSPEHGHMLLPPCSGGKEKDKQTYSNFCMTDVTGHIEQQLIFLLQILGFLPD